MPMQLAEACMSAEFINLYLLWAVGEERRWKSRLGGKEEEGKQHTCRLCSDRTGRKWRRKETIRENRQRHPKDKQRHPQKYLQISRLILSSMPSAWWLFSPTVYFPSQGRQPLAFATVAMGLLEGSAGLKSNFNTAVGLAALLSKARFRFTTVIRIQTSNERQWRR